MDKHLVLLASVLCFLASYASAQPSDMWEIIERGDKEREKLNLTIDGGEKRRIVESDIAVDEEEEKFRREMLSKRESLPMFESWHLKLWRTRVIPYIIDGSIPDNNGREYVNCLQELKNAMEYISSKVCVTFRAYRSSDTNWFKFYKGTGCFSTIGRKYYATKSTDISIGSYCCSRGLIVHEILHALGFYHEQSRRDRDSYVNTYLQNVQEQLKHNFDKNDLGDAHYEGTEYDPKSLMQYARTAFRINTNVITTSHKFDYNMDLGSNDLSETDIKELNLHYRCDVSSGWSKWSEMGPCIQQTWGSKYCTRGKVRICMGTGTCSGQNIYGVQENVEDCKSNPSLKSTCTYPSEDGHWSNWGEYSKCYSDGSSGCGLGIRTRERTCTNPAPKYGGKDCVGNFNEKTICRNPKCAGYQNNADVTFNSGFGKWQSDGFIRRIGAGPYSNVGPREDVLRTGYYAVFSAPSSTYPKKGKLTSPLIPKHPDGNFCFILHYQLNGRKYPSESLSVYIEHQNSGGSKTYTNLLRLDGHQGDYWTRRGFTIAEAQVDYKIVVEARSYSVNNDVAVDDIFIDAGTCYAYINNNYKDYHSKCESYALGGHCSDKYRFWMTRNCAPKCSECKDKNAKCGEWAKSRECITNSNWMLWNCCKSCYDVCRNEDGQICRDNASYVGKCPGWAESGECSKNSVWMSNNCYQSCYEVLRN